MRHEGRKALCKHVCLSDALVRGNDLKLWESLGRALGRASQPACIAVMAVLVVWLCDYCLCGLAAVMWPLLACHYVSAAVSHDDAILATISQVCQQ